MARTKKSPKPKDEDAPFVPKARTYRRAKLNPAERADLTSALMRHLVKPGLIPACEIILNNMTTAGSVAAAQDVIRLAKELILKGFPEPGDKDRAQDAREELDALEDETDDSPKESGGGKESPNGRSEAELLEEGGADVLPGEEDVPAL